MFEEIIQMLESKGELPEDFKAKLTTVLEAAASEIAQAKLEEQKEQLQESLQGDHEELVETVATFLETAADKYLAENALAIDSTIKVELAEALIEGVVATLQENSINVPEGKEDLVESLEAENEQLRSRLDETIISEQKALKELNAQARENIFAVATANVSEAKQEKIETLLKGMIFESNEEYKQKVETLVDFVSESKGMEKDGDEKDKDEKDGDEKDKDEKDSDVKEVDSKHFEHQDLLEALLPKK